MMVEQLKQGNVVERAEDKQGGLTRKQLAFSKFLSP